MNKLSSWLHKSTHTRYVFDNNKPGLVKSVCKDVLLMIMKLLDGADLYCTAATCKKLRKLHQEGNFPKAALKVSLLFQKKGWTWAHCASDSWEAFPEDPTYLPLGKGPCKVGERVIKLIREELPKPMFSREYGFWIKLDDVEHKLPWREERYPKDTRHVEPRCWILEDTLIVAACGRTAIAAFHIDSKLKIGHILHKEWKKIARRPKKQYVSKVELGWVEGELAAKIHMAETHDVDYIWDRGAVVVQQRRA